jgi:hypothetical protein
MAFALFKLFQAALFAEEKQTILDLFLDFIEQQKKQIQIKFIPAQPLFSSLRR